MSFSRWELAPATTDSSGCNMENCTFSRILNDRVEAVDDATAGMIIVILLFVLPSTLSFWPFVDRAYSIVKILFLVCRLVLAFSSSYSIALH